MKNQGFIVASLGVLITLSTIHAIHEDPTAIEDDFESVFFNVNSNIGRNVVWGGEIVNLQQSPHGVTLTIVEIPIDNLGRDDGVRSSRGRFVAQSRGSLSPDLFSLGKLCIVTGTVSGSTTLPLGEQQYTYPVVSAEMIHPCGTDNVIALLRKPGVASPIKIQGPFCNETAKGSTGRTSNAPAKKTTMKGDMDPAAQTVVNGYWTCTMHPKVHRAGPGDCPMCGMKLVFHASDEDTVGTKRAEHTR